MRANPLMLLLLVASLSQADAGVSVGELSTVQSETFLYKAQGERAKALRELESEGGSISTAFQTGNIEGLPVVKLVSGPRQALRAILLYSGGYEVEARVAGPELPGGYRVASISLDSVVLSRSGKHYPLGFSAFAPRSELSTNPATSAPGLPGITPGYPAPVLRP